MHALLVRFTQAVRDEHGDTAALALSVLHKRALSSPRSLERSIARRLSTLSTAGDLGALQLSLPLDDGQGELNTADDVPAWSNDLSLADRSRERRMLATLAAAANDAVRHETKVRALIRLLRRIDEPADRFHRISRHAVPPPRRAPASTLLLHGGLNRDERSAALSSFRVAAAGFFSLRMQQARV